MGSDDAAHRGPDSYGYGAYTYGSMHTPDGAKRKTLRRERASARA